MTIKIGSFWHGSCIYITRKGSQARCINAKESEMKKILIAVDDTKGSKAVLRTFYNSVQLPEEVVLLHVERLQGRSAMIDMLGEPEMKTLKESLKDTEHKQELDRKAVKILDYYKNELVVGGFNDVRTVIREGHPADEILKVASEEGVDLVILGYSGRKGLSRLLSGSVAKDVEKNTTVPVLVARHVPMCTEPYSWKDAYTAVTVTTAIMLGMFLLSQVIQRGMIH
jgi:nucleotide-binding universal stress UspA family protein